MSTEKKETEELEIETGGNVPTLENNGEERIDSYENILDNQIAGTQAWGEAQAKNQQAQTDFVIEEIKQQEEQAQSDHAKELSAAYTDWQKQSNPYGVNAEQMTAMGMNNTGYSESSKIAMYTQYQNRVAVAKESIARAEIEFNNAITQAMRQNSSILAEIAYNTLKEINTIALEKFQHNNSLLEIKNESPSVNYMDVLNQIIEADKNNEIPKPEYSVSGALNNLNGNDNDKEEKNYTPNYKQTESGNVVPIPSNPQKNSSNTTPDNSTSELMSADWTLAADGGFNFGGGINRNTKFTDSNGNTYTAAQLVKKLVKEGVDKKEAEEYVIALTEALTSKHGGR